MKPVRNKQSNIKKLIFVRHGKAEDQVTGITDFERSLTLRGKSQSKLMAQLLASKEKDLGLVITSPAFRAIETAMIFGKEFKINHDSIKICSDLYLIFEPDSFIYLSSVHRVTRQAQSLSSDIIRLFRRCRHFSPLTKLKTFRNPVYYALLFRQKAGRRSNRLAVRSIIF